MAEATVEDLAPYPGDKVTADALAQHLAVSAWHASCVDVPRLLKEWEAAGLPTEGPLRDACVGTVRAASAEYAAAYLLRRLGESLTPDELDDVSLPYEGWSQHAVDHLETWLAEWGIDADALERVLAEANGGQPS